METQNPLLASTILSLDEEQQDVVLPSPPPPSSIQEVTSTLTTISKIVSELRRINQSDLSLFNDGLEKSVDTLLFSIHKMAEAPLPGSVDNPPPNHPLSGWGGCLADDSLRKIVQQSSHSAGLARQIKNMLTAMHLARKALSEILIRVLSSIREPIENDPTGYLSANLIFLNSLIKGLVESHVNTLKDIEGAMQAILTQSELSPQTMNSINSSGNIYLLKNHTECKGCGSKPVVGRSFLNPTNVLCRKCFAKEYKK
jgi:hypothetical protein